MVHLIFFGSISRQVKFIKRVIVTLYWINCTFNIFFLRISCFGSVHEYYWTSLKKRGLKRLSSHQTLTFYFSATFVSYRGSWIKTFKRYSIYEIYVGFFRSLLYKCVVCVFSVVASLVNAICRISYANRSEFPMTHVRQWGGEFFFYVSSKNVRRPCSSFQ